MKRQPSEVLRQWAEAIQDHGRGLTTWEMEFVGDVADRLDRDLPLSEKQEEVLERIYADRTP